MNNWQKWSKLEIIVNHSFHFPLRLPPLTLASLLMVQHREAEVMLWVKLEATSTEYLDGKALDSQ